MPPTRASYHHGALRETLLDVTLRLIEAEGIGAVSLRRIAKEAGVSPGAPYHHFADRAALLGALSARGFQLLADELAEARSEAASPVQTLTAFIRAYVGFAQRRPGYFRLMFRPELSGSHTDPATKAAMHAAERHLDDAIAACVAAKTIPAGQADALAATAWGVAHGIASLWLDGQFRADDDDPSAITAQVAAFLESTLTR